MHEYYYIKRITYQIDVIKNKLYEAQLYSLPFHKIAIYYYYYFFDKAITQCMMNIKGYNNYSMKYKRITK